MSISKPQNATLIDTLSEGYRAVNRRPWLMLVPILLNVYLWFGTPLSFAPLINNVSELVQQLQQNQLAQAQLESTVEGGIDLGRVDMRVPMAVLNFVPTLMGSSALGLTFAQAQPHLIDPQRTDTIQVSSLLGALLFFVLINMLALPISAVFLTQLAESVRDDHVSLTVWLRRTVRAGISILGYIAVLFGVLLVLGLPVALLASLLFAVSPALGVLAIFVVQICVFWAAVYSGFAPEAIVISGIGPVRALRASVQIVWRNFWGTLGLLALSLVVSVGTGIIWQQLSTSTVGLVVAIVGSAYIGSGLLAARMAFYRERLRRWHGKSSS